MKTSESLLNLIVYQSHKALNICSQFAIYFPIEQLIYAEWLYFCDVVYMPERVKCTWRLGNAMHYKTMGFLRNTYNGRAIARPQEQMFCVFKFLDVFLTISVLFALLCYDRWCHINGLAQDCSNSIANTLELLQFCTKPSISRPECDRSSGQCLRSCMESVIRWDDIYFTGQWQQTCSLSRWACIWEGAWVLWPGAEMDLMVDFNTERVLCFYKT